MFTTNIIPDKKNYFGYGLDYRLDKQNIEHVRAKAFNFYNDNIDGTNRMMDCMLTGAEAYSFPSTGSVNMSLASTNNSDIGYNVRIYYYETNTSESLTNQAISLNGHTKVNIGNVFRIELLAIENPLIGYSFNGDIDELNQVDLNLIRIPNSAFQALKYNILKLHMSGDNNNFYLDNPTSPGIPAGTTQYVESQRTSGMTSKKLNIIAHYLYVKEYN
jgi:hypothetical protein